MNLLALHDTLAAGDGILGWYDSTIGEITSRLPALLKLVISGFAIFIFFKSRGTVSKVLIFIIGGAILYALWSNLGSLGDTVKKNLPGSAAGASVVHVATDQVRVPPGATRIRL